MPSRELYSETIGRVQLSHDQHNNYAPSIPLNIPQILKKKTEERSIVLSCGGTAGNWKNGMSIELLMRVGKGPLQTRGVAHHIFQSLFVCSAQLMVAIPDMP